MHRAPHRTRARLLSRVLFGGTILIAIWSFSKPMAVGIDVTPEQLKALERLSKRIYRYLFLSGYARLDYRMTEDGHFYLLEANPNPQIAHHEDFADSAEYSGVPYDQLLQKIMTVGLNYAGRGT